MPAAGRWYVTLAACEAYQRLRGWPDNDEHFERAERELIELSAHASHRETRGHLQLWRSGRPLQLRWLVSTMPRPEGKLPQVVWVGRGKPPRVTKWENE